MYMRLLIVITFLLLAACGGQPDGEGNTPELKLDWPQARLGAELWHEQCFLCHGFEGEGRVKNGEIDMDRYSEREPLVNLIELTMPSMDASACDRSCAEKIAEYMLAGFTTGGASANQVIPASGPMQRLNRYQYNRTVRDLFDTKLTPADEFPADSRAYGYDTAGAVLLVDDQYLEALEKAATQLTDDFFSKPAQDAIRKRYLVCNFDNGDSNCVEKIIATFGLYAWRRPLNANEIKPYADFFKQVFIAENDAQFAMQLVFQGLILSPNFMFRVESDGNEIEAHPVGQYEMASRLSYLIWSSMPDEELFDLAAQGKLQQPEVLAAQVDRLFTSPKAIAFTEQFGAQYLVLHGLDSANPSPEVYPMWQDELAALMRKETLLFFQEFVSRNDLTINQLLSAPFSFVNETLADYYEIPGIVGDEFTKVDLSGSGRVGVFGHGSFLTSTSISNRTSPVARGMWVLEQLLCTKTPEPPDNVMTDLQPIDPNAEPKTTRERLEQHRADPNCRDCHRAIDSVGIGFENFDGIGRYRADEFGMPVDSAAVLPDGRAFTNAVELAELLSTDERLLGCFINQVSTYATGSPSGLESTRIVGKRVDTPTIRNTVREFVLSDLFRLRVPGLQSASSSSPEVQP